MPHVLFGHGRDLVQPEPVAAIGQAERRPHGIQRVFYRVGPAVAEIAVSLTAPARSALVACAEARLRLSRRMSCVESIQHFLDEAFGARRIIILENYSPGLWAHPQAEYGTDEDASKAKTSVPSL